MVLATLIAACGRDDTRAPAGSTLTVLAGSELRDIEPMLADLRKATGVELKMTYAGTLDAVEQLQGGATFDVTWLASGRYAQLVPEVRKRIVASERTMTSPVVLGLKASKARALGWTDASVVTWNDIAQAAASDRLTFGMTNPASSNTGFSALLGLASALSDKGDALEAADIDAKRLAAFFRGQKLTAGSSGWLNDAFVADQGRIDGVINYASTLIALNRGGVLKEPLVLIYPKEGIVTADYPIMLLDADKRALYDRVLAHVRAPAFQRAIAVQTFRKPINPDVTEGRDLYPATLVEIAFPRSLEVIDAILLAFANELRLPADATFVLDTSGSMAGDRLTQLRTAMSTLVAGDGSLTGRFATFRGRERISVIEFSDRPRKARVLELGAATERNAALLQPLQDALNKMSAAGGTAIYTALRQAYIEALERRRGDQRERYYSIVLMTDGDNRDGIGFDEFARWYRTLDQRSRDIRVFAVLFGDANQAELTKLAELTGGRIFDGRKADSLARVFKDIRSYQ
ncbi:MAG: VWA domain-containing protein [Proteobacteria bacterium]|nr:VWA domain-containing protein [Burkholderiales bacterium]